MLIQKKWEEGNCRIALSGTHCSGKTTLLNLIKQHETFKDSEFVPSVTRTLGERGFPINENSGDATQSLVLSLDIQNVFSVKGRVISDRCTFDTLMYTEYLYHMGKVTPGIYKGMKSMWTEYFHKFFDLIVIPDHTEIELQADGVRSENLHFRDQVWINFSRALYIHQPRLPYYILSGTPEERVEKLSNLVKNGTIGY